MLVTSISIPANLKPVWQRHRRQIMAMALQALRVTMRQRPVRRGVKREYNWRSKEFRIVTARFTEAQYDTLHFVAAATRTSVSLLVCEIIQMWLKAKRRIRQNKHASNYELFLCNWNENAGVITESLLLYRKNWLIPPLIQTSC